MNLEGLRNVDDDDDDDDDREVESERVDDQKR